MSGDFRKWGAPEGTPSNDPGEREGTKPKPDVNREPFAPMYVGGTDPGYGLDLGDGIQSVADMKAQEVTNV